jgi:hypothetical protein
MLFSSLAIYCNAFLLSGSETKKLPNSRKLLVEFPGSLFILFPKLLFKEAILSPKITHKLYLPNCVRDVAEFRKPPWEEAVILAIW